MTITIQEKEDKLIMPSLGVKIHEKRKEKRLTLKQLGEIIGFSHSYISQVERGLIMPSLSALMEISTGLAMTPGELLDSSTAPIEKVEQPLVEITYRNQRLSLIYPDSSVKNELLLPDYNSNFSITWLTFPPHSNNSSKKHRVRRGNLYGVVISGVLHFHFGIASHILERGDSISFKAKLDHNWVNPSDDIAELILYTQSE